VLRVAVHFGLIDHEQRCPIAATTILPLTAIGKLRLGTVEHAAPAV
jgi:hypothetical protein